MKSYTTRFLVTTILASIPWTLHAWDEEVKVKTELKESYRKQVESRITSYRTSLTSKMNMQLDFMHRVCELEENKRRKLEIAAKGALDHNLVQTRESLEGYYRYRQQRAELGAAGAAIKPVSYTTPTIESIQKQPVWKTAVEHALTDVQREQLRQAESSRNQERNQLVLSSAVSMLDQQILLDQDQRQGLRKLLEDHIKPESLNAPDSWNFYTITTRQVFPQLKEIPKDKLDDLLTKVQTEAWDKFIARYANTKVNVFGVK